MKSKSKHNSHRHPEAHRYLKLVRWSEEDGVFIGSCPPIVTDACHGDSEAGVIDQLVVIVDEWIDLMKGNRKTLPPGTNNPYSGKLTLRISPDVHRSLALRAAASGETLNGYIERTLLSTPP